MAFRISRLLGLLCVSASLRLCVKCLEVPLLIALGFCGTVLAAEAIPPIARVLPPEGIEIPADVRTRLETRLATTKKRLEAESKAALKPDVEVFTKAVELALVHREFYVEKDFAKADWALDEANKRLDALNMGESPWLEATGTLVQGYRSAIDDSAQPYGLVIPKEHDFSKPSPLYVWLHGRGDKNTDLHFLQERATRPGQITPPNAIVVHPFGRHCVGWKHAGEIDVQEVVEAISGRYKIDEKRIVLIGFSMGGAGAWHIGAHYAYDWIAVSPGAGFVDTARYQKITPDRMPEWYVQKLWGLYDVPDYVRNLFNTNVIAYSGELDKQREAAVIMEEAFKKEGHELTHLIGPGVEHKYEPKTLEDLLARLDAIVAKGRSLSPQKVSLQTRTMAYNMMPGLVVEGLEEHWRDSRVDMEVVGEDRLRVTTKNVTALTLTPDKPDGSDLRVKTVEIDGQTVDVRDRDGKGTIYTELVRDGQRWKVGRLPVNKWRKREDIHGPIDDAFMREFVIVTPSGKSRNQKFQAWMDFELERFRNRWRALMRGDAKQMKDADFVAAQKNFSSGGAHPNVILWGDADSNQAIRYLQDLRPRKGSLPISSRDGKWKVGETTYDGDRFVPAVVFPDPRESSNYVVLNSGLTFREAHDRTNSQQNPKLPDWAIIDITQPPDANAPGRIHDADFFDEQWQLKRQPKGP